MNFCLRSKVSNQADIARILVFHSQNGYQHIGPTEISEPLRREICDEFRERFGEKIDGKSRILVKNLQKWWKITQNWSENVIFDNKMTKNAKITEKSAKKGPSNAPRSPHEAPKAAQGSPRPPLGSPELLGPLLDGWIHREVLALWRSKSEGFAWEG